MLNRISLIFVLYLLIWCGFVCSVNAQSAEKLVVKGKVVAFENSLTRILKLTHVPLKESFFVQIKKIIKGKENAKYIRIIHNYMAEEYDLPKDLFTRTGLWRFELLRDSECDKNGLNTSEDIIASGKRVVIVGEDKDVLKNDAFPCYILRPGDLKKR